MCFFYKAFANTLSLKTLVNSKVGKIGAIMVVWIALLTPINCPFILAVIITFEFRSIPLMVSKSPTGRLSASVELFSNAINSQVRGLVQAQIRSNRGSPYQSVSFTIIINLGDVKVP
jgi:hypothetical protein